jgi:hypothetical protein
VGEQNTESIRWLHSGLLDERIAPLSRPQKKGTAPEPFSPGMSRPLAFQDDLVAGFKLLEPATVCNNKMFGFGDQV